MTTWDECSERWYRQYNERLRLPGTVAWPLVYGTAVHATLESYYKTGVVPTEFASLQIPSDVIMTADDEIEQEYWNAVLQVQMRRYFAYYNDDFQNLSVIPEMTEQVLETVFDGIKLRGKIDLGHRPKKGIVAQMDHKTSGRWSPDILNGWYFKFQFMFYPWLAQRATGIKVNEFTVNAIIKPSIRVKKDESLGAFAARLEGDMIQDPTKYFKRVYLPISKGFFERFETEILQPKLNRIKALTSPTQSAILPSLVRNLNTNHCVRIGLGSCPYLPLCTHGEAERFRYRVKPIKHEELDGGSMD